MTPENFQRTPLGESWNRIAREAVATALQQSGKGLPCSVVSVQGQFVTVRFEVNSGDFTLPNVTIPIATSEYDWIPVQPGDKGMTIPADVTLAGVNGSGGGVPNLVQSANLAALLFQPVANRQWTGGGGQRIVQGPGGVLLQTMGGAVSFNLTGSSISMTAGGHTLTVSAAGVAIDGKIFATHEHDGVTTGSGHTGPVV